MADVLGDLLGRRWVHSHEEDTDTEMVFRPDAFAFPPSRGRMSFQLAPDGTFTDRGPGPTDRPQEAGGRWKVDPDGRIVLLEQGTNAVRRRLDVESVSPDRLVLRR